MRTEPTTAGVAETDVVRRLYTDEILDKLSSLHSRSLALREQTMHISGSREDDCDNSPTPNPYNFAEKAILDIDTIAEVVEDAIKNLNRFI